MRKKIYWVSPLIMNNVGLSLILWNLDNDLRHIDFLVGFNIGLQPLLISLLSLLELLTERAILQIKL